MTKMNDSMPPIATGVVNQNCIISDADLFESFAIHYANIIHNSKKQRRLYSPRRSIRILKRKLSLEEKPVKSKKRKIDSPSSEVSIPVMAFSELKRRRKMELLSSEMKRKRFLSVEKPIDEIIEIKDDGGTEDDRADTKVQHMSENIEDNCDSCPQPTEDKNKTQQIPPPLDTSNHPGPMQDKSTSPPTVPFYNCRLQVDKMMPPMHINGMNIQQVAFTAFFGENHHQLAIDGCCHARDSHLLDYFLNDKHFNLTSNETVPTPEPAEQQPESLSEPTLIEDDDESKIIQIDSSSDEEEPIDDADNGNTPGSDPSPSLLASSFGSSSSDDLRSFNFFKSESIKIETSPDELSLVRSEFKAIEYFVHLTPNGHVIEYGDHFYEGEEAERFFGLIKWLLGIESATNTNIEIEEIS